MLFTIRAEATWLVLLPLKMLLASTPFSRKLLLVSRWPLAQIGWLPKPALAPTAAGKFRIDAGRKDGEPREAARGQGDGLDLGFFQNVAVGGINGIHQRRLILHRDRCAHLPDFQRRVHRGGAIGLHQNVTEWCR